MKSRFCFSFHALRKFNLEVRIYTVSKISKNVKNFYIFVLIIRYILLFVCLSAIKQIPYSINHFLFFLLSQLKFFLKLKIEEKR